VKRLVLLYRSAVGKKAIVAVTGAILLGFLLLHVVGNLKVFLPDASPGVPDFDVYSAFLRTMGEPILPHAAALWSVRVVLAFALVLHVVCVVQLARLSRRARPVGYERIEYVEATASGRWMMYSGALLMLFLAVHIMHLTTGDIDAKRFVHGAVYGNLYRAFGQWRFAVFYLATMLVLGSHLYHGAWSLFQTLGIDNPDRNRGLRCLAVVIAIVLPLTFVSVPIAFFSGMMAEPPSSHTSQLGGGH
jgi:succinate dehydrogenase / fumarate reductase cytochrome b subunit